MHWLLLFLVLVQLVMLIFMYGRLVGLGKAIGQQGQSVNDKLASVQAKLRDYD